MISEYYSNYKKNILKNNEVSITFKNFSYTFVKGTVINQSRIYKLNKTFAFNLLKNIK